MFFVSLSLTFQINTNFEFFRGSNKPVKKVVGVELDKKNILHTGRAKYSCSVCVKKFTTSTELGKHKETHKSSSSEASDENIDLTQSGDDSWHEDGSVSEEESDDESPEPTVSEDLTCNTCFDVFDNEDELKAHLELHAKLKLAQKQKQSAPKKKKSATSTKDKKLPRKIEQKDNTIDRSGGKVYKCIYCYEQCFTIKHYESHVKHREINSRCYSCGSSFVKDHTLGRHLTEMHGDECYVCKLKISDDLRSHINSHKKTREEYGNRCLYCEEDFSVAHLKEHVGKLKTVRSKLFCFLCDHVSSRKDDFLEHVRSEHASQCPLCKVIFEKGTDILPHVKSHEKLTIGCLYCNESEFTLEHLYEHLPQEKMPTGKCYFCKEDATNVLNHVRSIHGHQCYICFRQFKDLRSHVQSHEANDECKRESYSCFFCEETELTYEHFQSHTPDFASFKDGSFVCYFCYNTFTNSNDLMEHVEEDHRSSCCICQKETPDVYSHMKTHEQADSNEEKVCLFCNEPKQTTEHLSTHFEMMWDTNFHCYFCFYKTNVRGRIWKHVKGQHANECYVCGTNFPDRTDLVAHIRMRHQEKLRISDEPVFNYCTECKKLIDGDLEAHKETEHSRVCQYCSQKFRNELTHRNHIKYAHEKKLECEICGTQLTTPKGFRDHMLTHDPAYDEIKKKRWAKMKARTVECTVCSKMIPTFRLAGHMKTHSAEMSVCNVCGKSVKASSLSSHKWGAHEPKQCPICKKEYIGYSKVKVCVRRHQAIRKYKCDQCDKAYLYPGSLTIHKRLHTGEKPYPCSVCDRRFYTYQILYKHMLSHGIDTRAGWKKPKSSTRQ